MKVIHRANSRGFADFGWLKSYHTFSFGNYFHPERVHFGALRVLNDDTVAPNMGFSTHGHDNMEIISIPLTGQIAHKDSTGTNGIIKPGEVQIMSAGTGIKHSEFNPSTNETLNFLQIWILPEKKNIQPRYGQNFFSKSERKNCFQTIISPDKDSKSLWVNQNTFFQLADIDPEVSLRYTVKSPENGIYIFIISGKISIQDEILEKRDGLGLVGEKEYSLVAKEISEILVIEIPMNGG